MDRISFYLDEHIPKAVAKGLKQRGINSITCSEINTLGLSDMEQLALATEKSWVIVTRDNDFLVLHAQAVPHSGIVFATRPLSIGELINGLVLIHEILELKDMANHVEFL